MKIKEIMSQPAVSVTKANTALDVAKLMKEHDIGCVPIVSENGKLSGIITDRDLVLRLVAEDKNPAQIKAADIMTCDVASVSPETDVSQLAQDMGICRVKRMPVVDNNGMLVGIASLGDVATAGDFKTEISEALCDISSGCNKERK